MAIKKSELFATSLWKSQRRKRGGMDAFAVQGLRPGPVVQRYVSDKAASQTNHLLDVPDLGCRPGRAQGDKEIGDKMNKIIARFAEANEPGRDRRRRLERLRQAGQGQDSGGPPSNLVAIFDNPALGLPRQPRRGR